MENVRITALDGDTLDIEAAEYDYDYDGKAVVWLSGSSLPLDREATVRAVEALTARVEAYDAKEAAEAAKLKAGDKVTRRGTYARFVVISDEDAGGLVDVVSLETGDLQRNRRAFNFHRGVLLRTPGPRPRYNGGAVRAPF